MFKNKKSGLSSNEKKVLDEARKQYCLAFKKRANNAAGFEENIQCLKDLAVACHHWMAVVTPHNLQQKEAEERSMQAWFGFFRRQANEQKLQEIQILAEAKNYFLEGLDSMINEYLKQEPRITGLDYSEKHDRNFNRENRLIGTTDAEEFKITFSDLSQISFTDLNVDTLARVKAEFTAKMSALSNVNRPQLA